MVTFRCTVCATVIDGPISPGGFGAPMADCPDCGNIRVVERVEVEA